MNEFISILILFGLSVITQQIVSWAGGILDNIGTIEIPYANSTFEHERNIPMTTNILMNICVPNVILVFIFMFAQRFEQKYIEKYLLCYIIFFFLWRMILICLILGRKEMYNWIYELSIALISICAAFIIKKYFLSVEENVFISVSELKEEIWFFIIIILYKFIKLILDKKITQSAVLKETQIKQYIIRKFKRFYGKYNHLTEVNKMNRNMYIFLYATMIYEDYNRGVIIRKLEKIKLVWRKSASLGIMQVETSENLSDEESIEEFYIWLVDQIKERNLAHDGDWVRELAWEYNNDTKYADAVDFIYNALSDYLEEVPRFRKIFCMRDELTNNERYDYLQELQEQYRQGLLSKEKFKRKKQRFLKRVKQSE